MTNEEFERRAAEMGYERHPDPNYAGVYTRNGLLIGKNDLVALMLLEEMEIAKASTMEEA